MYANSSKHCCATCGRQYNRLPLRSKFENAESGMEQEPPHVCPECNIVCWQDAGIDDPSSAVQYLRQHEPWSQTFRAALAGPCLYYPGAGGDIDPALLFANSGAVSTVVYVDYLAGDSTNQFADVFHEFQRYANGRLGEVAGPTSWTMMETGILRADDFGFASPDAFYPNISTFGDSERRNRIDEMAVGRWARFQGRAGRPLLFLYFFTEAIQTYLNLWGTDGRAPLVVVVQNHGLGALWTRLDGDCLLYAAAQRLPKYLYVGDLGSEPWPGYQRVSRDRIDRNSMHGSARALFRADAPHPRNPHSPLNAWDGRSQAIHSERYQDFHTFKLARPDAWRW